MGYYSNACFVLNREAAAKLNTFLKDHKDTVENHLFTGFIDDHRVDQETGDELYYWKSVKWYEEFPEIDFAIEFMRTLPRSAFYFVRIGEDFSDMEEDGKYYKSSFRVSVVRKIVY